MWHTATFQARWKISLEQYMQLDTLHPQLAGIPRTNYFATSQDGGVLVYGGLHSTLLVWSIRDKALLHEISIPQLKDKCIVQLVFIGDTKVGGGWWVVFTGLCLLICVY